MRPPTVAIVGTPNVGKSTLFNRLVGRRRSLVGRQPGVTRDRIHADVQLGRRAAILVDTGGIFVEPGEGLEVLVRIQAEVAVAEADVILLVVDAREGANAADIELAAMLRRSGRPMLLVANKMDHEGMEASLGEMYALGLGDPIPISAEHGRGVPALVDALVGALPARDATPSDPVDTRALAIVGRPNVGKSSLLNALVQEERAVVSETPGTTRDSVDLILEVSGRRYRVIDTAGIRRAGRRGRMEQLSTLQATRSLGEAAVALLVLDGVEGITAQDLGVAGLARKHRRPFVTLVNKWDLSPGGEPPRNAFREQIARRLRFARYAPVLFVSARTGMGLPRIFPMVERVWESGGRWIRAAQLNRFLQGVNEQHTGRTKGGAPMRGLYMVQTEVHPPRFIVFTNARQPVHFSYQRFLENRLRETFGFDLTPLVLDWRLR